MYNDNLQYAKTRLEGTIITYKKEPCLINEVLASKGGVSCSYSTYDEVGKASVDDFDLTPIKLGFVNTPYGTGFLSRKPIREDWRQGLRKQNCISYGDVRKEYLLELSSLRKTVLNLYPDLDEAIATNKAFSRNFRISGGDLMYRGDIVGGVSRGQLEFFPQYAYLKPRVERTLFI